MSREELIELCIKKDVSAWDEFIRTYQDLVRKAVHYRLNKALRNDVDDIVQEVFLMLWKDDKLSRLRDVSRLKSWLTVVTMNLTRSFVRASYKKAMYEELPGSKSAMIEDIITSNEPNPAMSAEIKETMAHTEDRINALKENERIALELKTYEEHTQKEISGIMNISSNTVASLIRRAKIKIREGNNDKVRLMPGSF